MGLSALRQILATVAFDPGRLKGRTVAVDADNLIWSFATALGASGDPPRGPDGRSVAHLYGLVGRLGVYAAWPLDVRKSRSAPGVASSPKNDIATRSSSPACTFVNTPDTMGGE